MTDTATTKKDWSSDQEVRWCPGCGDYSILTAMQLLMPEIGTAPGGHRLHLGNRLRGAVPVLHEHLRDALDPRALAGDRDRPRHGPSRSRRVGRRRRRRHVVDRRQPPDPRAATQRQSHDPAVQQPDLRADQGSVLAHERGRQGHEVDADGLARPPVQPGLGGPRCRGDVRGPYPRHGPHPHAGDVPTGARPPRDRRSSRCTRTAMSSTTARSTRSRRRTPERTMLIDLRHGEPVRLRCRRENAAWCLDNGVARIVEVADVGIDAVHVHDETAADPSVAFALSRLGERSGEPDARRGVPGGRPTPTTAPESTRSSLRPRPRGAVATSTRCSTACRRGTSADSPGPSISTE